MNSVNKTLYIPLYGKAYVSKKGLFLEDKKAEQIWEREGFELKGKSASKWLAYYMGIRSAVYDDWLRKQMEAYPDAVIIHIGCGMDSRIIRVGNTGHKWYDVDFADVIGERRRYYAEDDNYRMIAGDVRDARWLEHIPETDSAIMVMEGVSMYLTNEELKSLMADIGAHFGHAVLLMDCYTVMAAKMSKHKNPINDVGVTEVYGIDDPLMLQQGTLTYIAEHNMTPQKYIDELHGFEKLIFRKLYAGDFAGKLYRLYEYRKN